MYAPVVNDMIRPFEGNINPVGPLGIKLYLQATAQIDKESDKLDVSVKKSKDIIDHFFCLPKKYGQGSLIFIVETGAGA